MNHIKRFKPTRWDYLATDKDIATIQQKIGHKGLPNDYIEFMQKYNDFRPVPEIPNGYCFKVHWSDQHDEQLKRCCSEVVFEFLDMIHPEPPLTNIHDHSRRLHTLIDSIENCLMPGEELIPFDTIPIGGDPGGFLVLMGIGEKNHGQIFYWVSDYSNESGEPSYNNVGFVAKSFTEFLESLYPYSE